MNESENEIQTDIRKSLSRGKTRVFRNHTGKVKCARTGKWHSFGIPSSGGGSDLIGFHSLTIEPHHVGKKIAVFLAIECKSLTGEPTLEQQNFIEFIRSQGGIAGIARSETDALTLILNYESI